jgi:exoribonuclease-2
MLACAGVPNHNFDLAASGREEMIRNGFDPDFSPAIEQQLTALKTRPAPAIDGSVKDLRDRLWSSIDNDSSRDLDQIEVAERVKEGTLILVGIADVDSCVAPGTPIDQHAASQTTTVYTPARTFPMLPELLSTDLTSLSPGEDRLALVIEMLVADDGTIAFSNIYRALVRNQFQLTYESIGPWLEGSAPLPVNISANVPLQEQLKTQDEAARRLHEQRSRLGALNFDRVEAEPIIAKGQVKDIAARRTNRASALIEDFMLAANEVMAKTLTHAGVSRIQRVVKAPERWPRIVELAAQHGTTLPAQPDSGALAAFLVEQKQKNPLHYPDLSLAVVKLMGPGEYMLARAGDPEVGHFGLATHDYTHSTAPNRRFADLVTQRLVKAWLSQQPSPYPDDELDGIARNCTAKEDAARKVERTMHKRAAALAFSNRVGQTFRAVVTGVNDKGVFVRVLDPPVEGKLIQGEHGVDVGDTIRVTLLNTDPQKGFIDFGR